MGISVGESKHKKNDSHSMMLLYAVFGASVALDTCASVATALNMILLFAVVGASVALDTCASVATALKSPCVRPFTSGVKDFEEFRMGYVSRGDDLSRSDNLLFYQNKIGSRPDNIFIDDMVRF